MNKYILLIFFTLCYQLSSFAQLGIGTTAPDASSVLDLTSTSKGLLVPRMTNAQISAISNPANALLVYQTDNTPGYYFNYGTAGTPDWRMIGNNVPIGTGVATRLAFWSTTTSLSSHPDLYWDNTNRRLGVGTTAPTAKLHLSGTASENQFLIRAYSTQSLDIMQVLGSAGQRYVTINDSGKMIIGGTGVTTGSNVFQIIPQGVLPTSSGTNSVFELDANAGANSDINIRLSGGGIPAFFLSKSRGTLAVPTNLAQGDLVGIYGTRGYNNGTWNDLAYISSSYQGNGTTRYGDLAFWTSNNAAPSISMYISPSGNVGIGTTSFAATNPEKLNVNAGSSTINAIYGYGTINNYLQLNIKNTNAGTGASSDITATADNGNDTIYTINMGIRSSGYNTAAKNITGANEAYLYTNGGNLAIGTATANMAIKFHTAGTTAASEKMRLDAIGRLGIGITAPNTSALLDITSTTRGFLASRMTSAQRSAISSPAQGLLVYQTDGTTGFYYYDGGWNYINTSNYVAGTGLTLSGNSFSLTTPVTVANGGTGAATFIAGRILFGNGTSAINTSANLFWNNTNSRLGIGVTNPATNLAVNGTTRFGTNGNTITEVIKATVARDIANCPANSTITESFTVTGAATTSSVDVSPQNALTSGLVIAYARVSAANTVQVVFTNTTAGGINMGNMNYYFLVVR
jgi:hypothetical protein